MCREREQYSPRNDSRINPEADPDATESPCAADELYRRNQRHCVNQDSADDGGETHHQGIEERYGMSVVHP